ncbi:uncharacterized protein N7503_001208 [Penicillium pulvis]|uniref:uncharacterized protein n=1 Tax=Penicillium pulvis TaxID=1562058 RepID=UPI0025498D1F|nr:uncharacterized protein N7503_001208 [Penicillium pulvis]KAJ5814458.1 hypothetical protein N7503_001208 [Penicillium pulvis]
MRLNQGFFNHSFEDLAALMDTNTPLLDDFDSFLSPSHIIPVNPPPQLAEPEPPLALLSPGIVPRPEVGETISRLGSRLPSLQPQEMTWRAPEPVRTCKLFDSISSETRQLFMAKLRQFSAVVPELFEMPSRLALSRYLKAYLNGFHEHLPFLHVPTLSSDACCIELLLAIASVGAQYCLESERAFQLFETSHAIAKERIQRLDNSMLPLEPKVHDRRGFDFAHSLRRYGSFMEVPGLALRDSLSESQETLKDRVQTAQALLLLMAEATWSNHRRTLRQALAIQSTLASLIRDDVLKTMPAPDDVSWEEWAKYESTKRTKWIVFCFFNLHTIVHNIPSLISSSEMDAMLMPCHSATFRATCEAKWRDAQVLHPCDNGSAAVLEDDITLIELALRNWKSAWKQTPDSSLDSSNPAGPVSFNSTALLRLAYIRLNADIGPGRALHTRDPAQIANAFLEAQIIKRTPGLLRAVLHAAHALSIPIRIGVHVVAQTQTFRWSIQHSLATLECAFLLSKWLEALSSPVGDQPISSSEHRMLRLVRTMLDETDYAVPSTLAVESRRGMRLLAANVLRVWANVFNGPTQVWAIVNIIGSSLALCANLVEHS